MRKMDFQFADQRGNEAGLSGAGTSHEVDHADVVAGQGIFDFLTDIFIPVHDLVQYFYFHEYSPPV